MKAYLQEYLVGYVKIFEDIPLLDTSTYELFSNITKRAY